MNMEVPTWQRKRQVEEGGDTTEAAQKSPAATEKDSNDKFEIPAFLRRQAN